MEAIYALIHNKSQTKYELNAHQTTIGRSPQCDIHLLSVKLSSQHAQLEYDGNDALMIKDLGSTNGTFVNAMRVITPCRVRHLDELQLADEVFTVLEQHTLWESERGLITSGAYLVRTENTMLNSVAFDQIAGDGRREPRSDALDILDKSALPKFGSSKNVASQADTQRVPAALMIASGPKTGTLIELVLPMFVDKKWTIGRSDLCDVIVDDPTVSSRHAELEWVEGRWELYDTNSTNGIRLNGKKVSRSFCSDGDTLTIGSLQLVFKVY